MIVAVPTPILADGDLRFDPPLDGQARGRRGAAARARRQDFPRHQGRRLSAQRASDRQPAQRRTPRAIRSAGSAGRSSRRSSAAIAPRRWNAATTAPPPTSRSANWPGCSATTGGCGSSRSRATRWRAERFIRGSYSHAKVGQARPARRAGRAARRPPVLRRRGLPRERLLDRARRLRNRHRRRRRGACRPAPSPRSGDDAARSRPLPLPLPSRQPIRCPPNPPNPAVPGHAASSAGCGRACSASSC